jgi:hypothetical protein
MRWLMALVVLLGCHEEGYPLPGDTGLQPDSYQSPWPDSSVPDQRVDILAPDVKKWITVWEDRDGDSFGDVLGSPRELPRNTPGWVPNNGDCMDTNNQVHPNQKKFFPTDRGDSKFDYNCDGKEESHRASWLKHTDCFQAGKDEPCPNTGKRALFPAAPCGKQHRLGYCGHLGPFCAVWAQMPYVWETNRCR